MVVCRELWQNQKLSYTVWQTGGWYYPHVQFRLELVNNTTCHLNVIFFSKIKSNIVCLPAHFFCWIHICSFGTWCTTVSWKKISRSDLSCSLLWFVLIYIYLQFILYCLLVSIIYFCKNFSTVSIQTLFFFLVILFFVDYFFILMYGQIVPCLFMEIDDYVINSFILIIHLYWINILIFGYKRGRWISRIFLF